MIAKRNKGRRRKSKQPLPTPGELQPYADLAIEADCIVMVPRLGLTLVPDLQVSEWAANGFTQAGPVLERNDGRSVHAFKVPARYANAWQAN